MPARSHSVSVKSGVPQGNVLGLCLFLIGLHVYMNDLPDDNAVCDEVLSAAEEARPQSNFDLFPEWEVLWEMVFHPSKCKNLSV